MSPRAYLSRKHEFWAHLPGYLALSLSLFLCLFPSLFHTHTHNRKSSRAYRFHPVGVSFSQILPAWSSASRCNSIQLARINYRAMRAKTCLRVFSSGKCRCLVNLAGKTSGVDIKLGLKIGKPFVFSNCCTSMAFSLEISRPMRDGDNRRNLPTIASVLRAAIQILIWLRATWSHAIGKFLPIANLLPCSRFYFLPLPPLEKSTPNLKLWRQISLTWEHWWQKLTKLWGKLGSKLNNSGALVWSVSFKWVCVLPYKAQSWESLSQKRVV